MITTIACVVMALILVAIGWEVWKDGKKPVIPKDPPKWEPMVPSPKINVKVWKAKDGWRWKAGIPDGKYATDWKCDSTEAFDTEEIAFESMQHFVCTAWEILK